jgi:hypothetical protein
VPYEASTTGLSGSVRLLAEHGLPWDKTCAAREHADELLTAQAHHPTKAEVEFGPRPGFSALTARSQPREGKDWLKRTQPGD